LQEAEYQRRREAAELNAIEPQQQGNDTAQIISQMERLEAEARIKKEFENKWGTPTPKGSTPPRRVYSNVMQGQGDPDLVMAQASNEKSEEDKS
jgi:hypothetical protein